MKDVKSEKEILYNRNITENENGDWQEISKVGDRKLQIKLGTGAQCNVLPKCIGGGINVEIKPSSTKRLISFTENRILVIGEANIR